MTATAAMTASAVVGMASPKESKVSRCRHDDMQKSFIDALTKKQQCIWRDCLLVDAKSSFQKFRSRLYSRKRALTAILRAIGYDDIAASVLNGEYDGFVDDNVEAPLLSTTEATATADEHTVEEELFHLTKRFLYGAA